MPRHFDLKPAFSRRLLLRALELACCLRCSRHQACQLTFLTASRAPLGKYLDRTCLADIIACRAHDQIYSEYTIRTHRHYLRTLRHHLYHLRLPTTTGPEKRLSSPNQAHSAATMAASGKPADLTSEDGSVPDYFGEHVDSSTFEQILEMDDDEEEREFSKSIVYDFFQQAETTFEKMDSYLDKEDLAQLSALGHFLKGSSATLGLTKLKDSCEKIQHFGAKKDATGTHDETDVQKSLSNCKKTIQQAKGEFKEAEMLLRRFYHDE